MTITARYADVCKDCGGQIEAGEEINWLGRGKGSTHATCPANPVPAPAKKQSNGNGNGYSKQPPKPRITEGADFDKVKAFLLKLSVGDEPLNEFQSSLLGQALTKGLTRKQIDKALEMMQDGPKKPSSGSEASWKDKPRTVPAGRYAINEGTKKAPEWAYYRVWIGDRGNEPPIFVYAVKGTEKGERLSIADEVRVLKAIDKVSPAEAAKQFGHRTGNCGRCGLSLDVNLSRKLGIGPTCMTYVYDDEMRLELMQEAREKLRDAGIDPEASLDNLEAVMSA